MSLRILITGANGQVGWHLQRTLGPLGQVTALTREQLDLSDLDMVTRVIRELQPDILVNAAAYTAVDKAESEPELARTVNADAPARMARELARSRCLLVHYSTDYVFNGEKSGPYEEQDPTAPLSVYGRTKLDGEQLIAESGCPYIVLRTSWVYDIRGKNFLKTVLRLAGEREALRMVDDQRGAPTWARSIAEATAVILVRSLEQKQRNARWSSGVFHLTAAGETSWAGLAQAILEEYDSLRMSVPNPAELGPELRANRIVPIKTEEYPTPARRPRNSVLSNALLKAQFGIELPHWRAQLRLAIEDMVRR
ncbi:MAG: dTDP-4-dehydrorhamnose reductase [Candidatus Korobacteraceae bacterium]